MSQEIPLIDGFDGFEIVRDAVASILISEIANQQTLASVAGNDPDDWKVRVMVEQPNAFDIFMRDDLDDRSPVCNVSYNNSSTDLAASDLNLCQQTNSIIYLDICAVGRSKSVQAGHTPGGRVAAFNANRASRFVRQILMHDKYDTLGMPGFVGRRYVSQRDSFVPVNSENVPINNVHGMRLQLMVDHNETITTQDYGIIEQIFIEHTEEPEGPVLSTLLFTYV